MSNLAAVERFESEFWGNCTNTFGEERKQLVYAKRMGLSFHGNWRSDFNIDMHGKSVLDIGGGPASLLLKCHDVKGMIVDPLRFPDWVYSRYQAAGIRGLRMPAENLDELEDVLFDEVWIYNVLQHVEDAVTVIENARRLGKMLRLFDWIDMPPYEGHPIMLTQEMLEFAVGKPGKTEYLNETGCLGRCFYGAWDNENCNQQRPR